MESLSGSDRNNAFEKVAKISAFRRQGYSDDEVASKTGYRGAGHMRQELEQWGFPAWFIEGDPPLKPSKPAPRERVGRGSGPVKELPQASNATPLFREKLEALTQGNEDLRYRKEKLQGGRFQQSAVYTDPVYLKRDLMSAEEWKSICEQFGMDPEADNFLDKRAKTWSLGDGTPTPQAPLPALIAVYVLMEGDLEPLLDALYPGVPPPEVRNQIRTFVEGKKNDDKRDGLKTVARQLATLVRGGEVGKGRDPAFLSRREVNLACRITEARKTGVPDPEIFEKLLHNLWPKLEKELTWDEYCRLRALNLKWPFRGEEE